MSDQAFKSKAYVKEGCPFSFKFLTFMAEAGLLGEIEVVRVEGSGPAAESTKQFLGEKLGRSVTFPTVEIEPGRYMTDSDALIDHFAKREGKSLDTMLVLSFYKETILPKLFELHKLKMAPKTA
jgi:glutaredoxin 2